MTLEQTWGQRSSRGPYTPSPQEIIVQMEGKIVHREGNEWKGEGEGGWKLEEKGKGNSIKEEGKGIREGKGSEGILGKGKGRI